MREILFRGKRKDNGEWLEGSALFADNKAFIFNNVKVEFFNGHNEYRMNFTLKEVIPETVGQYTGLTDKNGKKIFEGDIIKYKNTDGIKFNGVALTVIGKVVYNEKNASFAISGKDEIGAKHYDYFPIKKIEVIGNIHDNPELMKGGDGNG